MSEETKPASRKSKTKKAAAETKKTQAAEGTKKKLEDIKPYVSNIDSSVYAITGLPEEFIATLFAWVSRSPKSFKEHLRRAVEEFQLPIPQTDHFSGLNKKSKEFHEKWTVGYGHSSVAEHATAHIGVEDVSRLASAELELANTFLSITEYSQRYQKPKRKKWHNPINKEHVSVRSTIEDFYESAFDSYEKLINGVYEHLKSSFLTSPKYEEIKKDKKAVDRELNALKKLAYEDARYALPLAMHTQLGLTANGRALRDALAVLGNSKHTESQILSANIRTEVSKVLPVLLKHAVPSQYQRNAKKRMAQLFQMNLENVEKQVPPVILFGVQNEEMLLHHLVALLLVENECISYPAAYSKARYLGKEKISEIIKELLFEMEHFDMAPDVFKHVKYEAMFLVSEANWHQLLRHNRKTDFIYSNPTPKFGIKIPPRILEAGLSDVLKGIAQKSKELYNTLVIKGFQDEAEYVVLNSHLRQIYASFNLWEAYHLINLRTSDEAQWDIKETFEELYKQLRSIHPLLISNAKRRT